MKLDKKDLRMNTTCKHTHSSSWLPQNALWCYKVIEHVLLELLFIYTCINTESSEGRIVKSFAMVRCGKVHGKV